MAQVGTTTNPLRVAIIGAGPSGFYVAEHPGNHPELIVEIDLIERLPTPYGLVRGGVAPDHPKINSSLPRTTRSPRIRGSTIMVGSSSGAI